MLADACSVQHLDEERKTNRSFSLIDLVQN